MNKKKTIKKRDKNKMKEKEKITTTRLMFSGKGEKNLNFEKHGFQNLVAMETSSHINI